MKRVFKILSFLGTFSLGYFVAIFLEVRGPLEDESIYSSRTNKALWLLQSEDHDGAKEELRWLSYVHSNRYFMYRNIGLNIFNRPDDVFCAGFSSDGFTVSEYQSLFGEEIINYVRPRLTFCAFELPHNK
jgi:hypothetical protein